MTPWRGLTTKRPCELNRRGYLAATGLFVDVLLWSVCSLQTDRDQLRTGAYAPLA